MGLFPRNINDFLVLQGIPRGPDSQVYFVDPASGSDTNPGTNFASPLASIEAAYALCTANQHDVVLYIAGSSGNDLAAAVTWSKDYTHLIGWCANTMVAQRSRIFQTSTLTGASPLLTISASGCIFKNFYIFQGVDDATSLINVKVTGGRNYFENVHFAGGGHTAMAINGCASLYLDAAEENTFVGCTIGVDTIALATGGMVLLFDNSAKRNIFKDCVFRIRSGHTACGFAEVMATDGIARDTIFKNCTFINQSTTTGVASAFVIPASVDADSVILLQDCMFVRVTTLDASDRGIVYGNMDVVVPADLSGVALELIT